MTKVSNDKVNISDLYTTLNKTVNLFINDGSGVIKGLGEYSLSKEIDTNRITLVTLYKTCPEFVFRYIGTYINQFATAIANRDEKQLVDKENVTKIIGTIKATKGPDGKYITEKDMAMVNTLISLIPKFLQCNETVKKGMYEKLDIMVKTCSAITTELCKSVEAKK